MSRQAITLELNALATEPTATMTTATMTTGQVQDPSRRAFVRRLGMGAAAVAGCALLADAQTAAANNDFVKCSL